MELSATRSPGDTQVLPTTRIVYSDASAPADFPRWIREEGKENAAGDYLIRYTYQDGLGRVVQTKADSEEANAWDAVGFHYDTLGRNFKTSVPYRSAGFPFNHGGERTGAERVFTQTLYDPIGRVSKVIGSDETQRCTVYQKQVEIYLDPNGHVRAQRASGNRLYDYTYIGQYTYEGLQAGFTVESGYYTRTTTQQARGGTRITDTLGNVLQTTIDMLGRKTAYSDPDMGQWGYDYDRGGNLVSQTDANLQSLTFAYDPLNRFESKTYPDGSQIRYYYDDQDLELFGFSVGRLTRITRWNGAVEVEEQRFCYDERGRVAAATKTIQGASRTLSSDYDPMDRLIEHMYPDGELVSYIYNGGGRLEEVSGLASYAGAMHYTPWGALSNMGYGNGVVTSFDYYDSDAEWDPSCGKRYSYRLKRIQLSGDPDPLFSIDCAYDPSGNVATKLSVGGSRYDAESFGYDELDRLVWADGGSLYGAKSYSYDLLDNLSSKDGRSFGYTHPSKPHALTEDGQYSYLYDANGNLVERREGELVERSYGYDPDNRLVSLSDGGSYGYDASGRRLWKVEGQKTTYCFFPQYEEEVEDGQPAEAVSYYFAGARRVGKRSASEGLVYLHADHLGSAVRVTDGGSGAVELKVGYTPYGQDALEQGSVEVKHKFTGQEQDSSGLYYYGARYYDPGLGRFIQPDILLDGLNRYAYCRDNPLRHTDPTGYETEDLSLDDSWGHPEQDRQIKEFNAALENARSNWAGVAPFPLPFPNISDSIADLTKILKDAAGRLSKVGLAGLVLLDILTLRGSVVETEKQISDAIHAAALADLADEASALEGKPNTTGTITGGDGNINTEREFDEKGKAKKDRDYKDPTGAPHEHEWDGNSRSHPGEPVDVPVENDPWYQDPTGQWWLY